MQFYLETLVKLKNDPYVQVRWRVVQGISSIMDLNLELILNNFNLVAETMISALKEKD